MSWGVSVAIHNDLMAPQPHIATPSTPHKACMNERDELARLPNSFPLWSQSAASPNLGIIRVYTSGSSPRNPSVSLSIPPFSMCHDRFSSITRLPAAQRLPMIPRSSISNVLVKPGFDLWLLVILHRYLRPQFDLQPRIMNFQLRKPGLA